MQAETLMYLVQTLRELVPVDGAKRIRPAQRETGNGALRRMDGTHLQPLDSFPGRDPWAVEFEQILAKMEAATRKDVYVWLSGPHVPNGLYQDAAVGADREKEDDEQEGRKHSVSPAGLLNALDGVASKEGRILIMTTNHIEKLDSTLIRPGRIDLRVELNYADFALTAQFFGFMYTPAGEAEPLSEDETLVLERQAREFADAIPEHTFSIASCRTGTRRPVH